MTTDYPDWGSEKATAQAIGTVDLSGTGLAKDTTVTTVHTDISTGTNKLLDGTNAGPLTDTRDHTLTTANNVAAQTSGGTIANEISTTGAPLLHNSNSIDNATFTFGAVGGTHTTPTVAIKSVCYEVYVSLQNALPAGSASYVIIQIDFFDSGSGLQLAKRRFKLVSGSNATPHTVKIAGPVHGNQMRMVFTEVSDSVNLVTVVYNVFATSRLYQRDVMRTTIFGSDGLTAAGCLPEYDTLSNTAPLTAASGQQTRLMAPYSGLVHVMGFTSSGTSDFVAAIIEAFTSAPALVNTQVVAELVTNSLGFFDQFIALPHIQCQVQLNNRNAAQQTLSFMATIQEPAN